MTDLAADLWWIAGPLVAWMLAFVALREILRPPRHVLRLEARVAILEQRRTDEHARVMRLDTVVRTVEADVAGVVDELAPTEPPEPTERVPYEGWPNLVVTATSKGRPTVVADSDIDAGWCYDDPHAPWNAELIAAGYEPSHVPTLQLAAVRGRRPPTVATSIPEALAFNDRPMTLAQIAGALGRPVWDLRPELNDLIQAGTVRFADTHDHETAFELENR